MHPAPLGTTFVEAIGSGSVFDVAVVREGDRLLVSKRLASPVRDAPEARAAMVREAKLLAMARHAALPAIVRVGADGHGPFLLETRADGASLREILEGWELLGRKVPRSLVVHVAREACVALAEIQERSDEEGPLELVHGDLGPDHVRLGPLGQIRFVDFGAARFRGMDPALETKDRGTLPFVAPEIARGEVAPNARGDVYSLAATLLFLATGKPLTKARDEAAMLLEIGERGIDRTLLDQADAFSKPQRDALHAALSPRPDDRPPCARAMATAFG